MSSLFGLDSADRFVFVNEVPRGLACQCRCIVCAEPLIARQGAVREHHFAHASGREPCDVNHESVLHRYAKRVIQEAGGLTVPVDSVILAHLGRDGETPPSAWLELPQIDVERSVGDLRPDLLGHTDAGLQIAIEVAYTSFCDLLKIDRFAQLGLPVLEIDLRAFTPEAFEPEAVRAAVLHDLHLRTWLWPNPGAAPEAEPQRVPPQPVQSQTVATSTRRLPEEIVTISGRWVSIKRFPSGDIAVKVVTYDPDVVSMVKTIAKANHGRYSPQWKTWNVPRWCAEAMRMELRRRSKTVSIVIRDQP